MGLWHGVEHWERNKIMTKSDTELFTDTWDEVRIRTTQYNGNLSCIFLQAIVNSSNIVLLINIFCPSDQTCQ